MNIFQPTTHSDHEAEREQEHSLFIKSWVKFALAGNSSSPMPLEKLRVALPWQHGVEAMRSCHLKLAVVASVLCLLAGCQHAPAMRLPVWVEAFDMAPASEVTEAMANMLPIPEGWQVWPCQIRPAGITPQRTTNEGGAIITWQGQIEFNPAPVPAVYRVEYLGSEFGPAFYKLFDLEHDGRIGQTFVEIIWTQPYAFEPRLLFKSQLTP